MQPPYNKITFLYLGTLDCWYCNTFENNGCFDCKFNNNVKLDYVYNFNMVIREYDEHITYII